MECPACHAEVEPHSYSRPTRSLGFCINCQKPLPSPVAPTAPSPRATPSSGGDVQAEAAKPEAFVPGLIGRDGVIQNSTIRVTQHSTDAGAIAAGVRGAVEALLDARFGPASGRGNIFLDDLDKEARTSIDCAEPKRRAHPSPDQPRAASQAGGRSPFDRPHEAVGRGAGARARPATEGASSPIERKRFPIGLVALAVAGLTILLMLMRRTPSSSAPNMSQPPVLTTENKPPDPNPRTEPPKETQANLPKGGVRPRIEEPSPVPPIIPEKRSSADEVRQFVNPGALPLGKLNVVAVINPQSRAAETDLRAAERLPLLLHDAAKGVNIVDGYFRAGFEQTAYYQQLQQGSVDALRESGALRNLAFFILGTVSAHCGDSPAIQGMFSCTVALDFRQMDNTGARVDSGHIEVVGPGFSQDQALQRGLEMLLEQHADRLFRALPKGE